MAEFKKIEFDIRFPVASKILVCGPTRAGKSVAVYKMLTHQKKCFAKDFDKVFYFYSCEQPLYGDMRKNIKGIEFHKGLPEPGFFENETTFEGHNCVVVLDDVQHEAISSTDIYKLVVMFSHHFHVSVIFLVHGMYLQGKFSSLLTKQFDYYLLFPLVRDFQSIEILGRQLLGPGRARDFIEIFQRASGSRDYGFLLVDCCSRTPKELRFRAALPYESTQMVFEITEPKP